MAESSQQYVKDKLKGRQKDSKAVVKFWKEELGEDLKLREVNGALVFSEYIVSAYAPSRLMSEWKLVFACGNASAYVLQETPVDISLLKTLAPYTKGAISVSGECVLMRYPNMASVNPSYKVIMENWYHLGTFTDQEWEWRCFGPTKSSMPAKPEAIKIGMLGSKAFIKGTYIKWSFFFRGNLYNCIMPWGKEFKESLLNIGFEERNGVYHATTRWGGYQTVSADPFIKDHVVATLANGTLNYWFGDSIITILKSITEHSVVTINRYALLDLGNASETRLLIPSDNVRISRLGNLYAVRLQGSNTTMGTDFQGIFSQLSADNYPQFLDNYFVRKGNVFRVKDTIRERPDQRIFFAGGSKPGAGFEMKESAVRGTACFLTDKGYTSLETLITQPDVTAIKPDVLYTVDYEVMLTESRTEIEVFTDGKSSTIYKNRNIHEKYPDEYVKLLRNKFGVECTPGGCMWIPATITKSRNPQQIGIIFTDGSKFLDTKHPVASGVLGYSDLDKIPSLKNYGKLTKVAFYSDEEKIASSSVAKTLKYTSTGWNNSIAATQPASTTQPTSTTQPAIDKLKVGKWVVELSDTKDAGKSVAHVGNYYVNVSDENWDPLKIRALIKLLRANDLIQIEGTAWHYTDSEFQPLPLTSYVNKIGNECYGVNPKDWATDRRCLSRVNLPNFQTTDKCGCTYWIPSCPVKYVAPIVAAVNKSDNRPAACTLLISEFKKLFGSQVDYNRTSSEATITFEKEVWWDDYETIVVGSGLTVDKVHNTIIYKI